MADPPPRPDPAKAIEAIYEARPPATDHFTYLTIIEANLIPEVLPALHEVLQDAKLTQNIGWDLVYNLVSMQGSEACLESIARLGNPREVILKVLESLELLHRVHDGHDLDEGGDEQPVGDEAQPGVVSVTQKFIALLGMLAILHKRIKTKRPSRFLAQTLQTVFTTYRPNSEMTAAVINLVHSLSGKRRPPLPSRKSSINITNMGRDDDNDGTSKNAPDPEAERDEGEDPVESELLEKFLLTFVTCILEVYVNANEMAWAQRLLEFYNADKVVPGRRTMLEAFREEQNLLERDAIVGQLVALIRDLGLSSGSRTFVQQLVGGPLQDDPLSELEGAPDPAKIPRSTGGGTCLLAYWVFSSTVFDADVPKPEMEIFPEHFALLDMFMQDDAHSQINKTAGTIQALVALGLWLHANDLVSANPMAPIDNPTTSPEAGSDYMRYTHLVTLIALYHPQIQVRNAASTLASQVLHSDPSDEDRLRILQDLLENCTFASLNARAVSWLREEILAAASPSASSDAQGNLFATDQALESLQHFVFPNLDFLRESEVPDVVEYLFGNSVFLLQAVNFGLFLFSNSKWRNIIPVNMEATVRERWYEPLADAVERVQKTREELGEAAELGPLEPHLDVLRERLPRLAAAEGFAKE